jgi:hypothetical protein
MDTTTYPTDRCIAELAAQLVEIDVAAHHLREATRHLVEVGELADDALATVEVGQVRLCTVFNKALVTAIGFELGDLVQAAAWYWDADADAPAPFAGAAGAADVAHRLVAELKGIYRNGNATPGAQTAASRMAALLW